MDVALKAIRAGGLTVTEYGNIGTVGLMGSISDNGMTITIDKAAYMTHNASGEHGSCDDISIDSIGAY